jgi:hypothetical protein
LNGNSPLIEKCTQIDGVVDSGCRDAVPSVILKEWSIIDSGTVEGDVTESILLFRTTDPSGSVSAPLDTSTSSAVKITENVVIESTDPNSSDEFRDVKIWARDQ